MSFSSIPLSYKEIWKETFRIYKKTFLKVLPIVFILSVIISLSSIATYFNNNLTSHFSPIFAAGLFVMIIFGVFLINLIIYQIYVQENEQVTSYSSSIKYVANKYFRLLIASIVISIITLLGVIVLIVPGIFLAILLIFTEVFILVEDNEIYPALKGSCLLVWGNWWRTFFVIAPVVIVNVLINALFNYLGLQKSWVSYVVNSVIFIIYFPFLYSVILVQFYDLKARKAIVKS